MTSDSEIWRAICDMNEATGWPAGAIVDALAHKLGVDADRIRQVWRERQTMTGAG